MGVTKLWEELAPQQSVSLAELSRQCMTINKRPLRLAVDIYPRIFGDKGTTDAVRDSGGMNHAAKNVFYFALHFVEAGVQPIFVYDGPNKPTTKRGEQHGYTASKMSTRPPLTAALASSVRSQVDKDRDQSIQHVVSLTQELFDAMGLPWLMALGEGEAECCALEKLGLVDDVVTTDGDAFVFGGKHILRLCNKKSNGTRRAEVYDARQATMISTTGRNLTSGLWLLLALVSGGDYDGGLPGCGPPDAHKLYDEHGGPLDKILESAGYFTPQQVQAWSRQLSAKLKLSAAPRTQKLAAKLSGGFSLDILKCYLSPAVHEESYLQTLIHPEAWAKSMDVVKLRQITETYFDWKGRDYFRKFASILCPTLLTQCLMNPTQFESKMLLWKGELRLGKRRSAKDDAPSIKVSYHPELLLGLEWADGPVLEGYERNFAFNPGVKQTCFMPEWLVEYGVRQQYETWCDGSKDKPKRQHKGKKRALPEGDGGVTPKRSRPVLERSDRDPTPTSRNPGSEGKKDAFIPYDGHVDDEVALLERFATRKRYLILQGLDFDSDSSNEDFLQRLIYGDATGNAVTASSREIQRAMNLNRIDYGQVQELIFIPSSPSGG